MNIENINITKVSILKNGGVSAQWEQKAETEDTIDISKCAQTSNDLPHPDLNEALQELKYPLTAIISLEYPRLLRITGITKNDKSVIIHGEIKTEAGIPVKISSHRIKLSDEVYGFEKGLAQSLDTLDKEVFAYLFEGKRPEYENLCDEEA